ncbi:MAG: hypothetical protein WCK79_06315 [Actinomycetes bacterium]
MSAEGENFVEQVKDELSRIDSLPVNEHADSFEAVHQNLERALSTIDGL